MSSPSSTPPAWSGPGIIQSFISIPKTSEISPETLKKWFDEAYAPNLLATGHVTSAWWFDAADESYERPHMIICKLPDVGKTLELKNVDRKGDMLPEGRPIEDFVEFDASCVYALDQYFEKEKQPEATTLIMAAMEPKEGGAADLDAWYREEHNEQMSKEPGWKRSTRFKLLYEHKNEQPSDRGWFTFLALHEFGEGHQLGKEVVPLEPMSDWTKRVMGECKAIDAAIYNKVKSYGKATE